MVHSGYEASAVDHTFSSLSGLWSTLRATFSSRYKDAAAERLLGESVRPVHAFSPLVQIEQGERQEKSRAGAELRHGRAILPPV